MLGLQLSTLKVGGQVQFFVPQPLLELPSSMLRRSKSFVLWISRRAQGILFYSIFNFWHQKLEVKQKYLSLAFHGAFNMTLGSSVRGRMQKKSLGHTWSSQAWSLRARREVKGIFCLSWFPKQPKKLLAKNSKQIKSK